ncbi:MAG: hypothetical protein EFT35_01390 [Methanophagales archaeon ANME-1-THS]|nr:MAG: hypothetical protein EFT35_01390 [Methanophagales archaeon ANME-1-THS]
MKNLSISYKIYIALIILLVILAAGNVFLPQALPEQELPASKPVLALVNAALMLVLYGGLGLLGLKLAQKLGFPNLWDENVSLKGKWQNQIFWIAAIFSALVFALGHLPAVMILFEFKTIAEIPAALMSEIILLNGIVSLFAAHYLKKYGFLAPVGIHFWTDIVWHVVWGAR